MLLEAYRQKVIKTAQKTQAAGLVPLTFGNFSLRDTSSGYICITPSGMEYEALTPRDIVVLDIDGNILDGKRKPSVETPLHLAIYRQRKDIAGICHTHSTYATAWASCDAGFPILVAELAGLVGDQVGIAPYKPLGTRELAEAVVAALQDKDAVLLSNHGLVAVGWDLDVAFNNAVVVEEGAKIAYLAAGLGKMKPLPAGECRRLREWIQKNYGQ